MHKPKEFLTLLVVVVFGLGLAGAAIAGPGSVEVTVPGDITLKMGGQVRFVPTSEIDRDFGLSDGLTDAQELNAANALRSQVVLSSSPRSHLTESSGATKDNYIRTEDRLFFNFAKDKDWDVYFMLEVDTIFQSHAADRTDFAAGNQSQQFGVERLNASFNLPALHSRLRGGWDARGIDIGYGGMVYGDDDPGLGLVGGVDGSKWEVWWIKKIEDESGYSNFPTTTTNPIGPATQRKDADRDFYYAKLGHQFNPTFLEAFYMWHRNRVPGSGKTDIDQHIAGLQGKGTYGIVKPIFEVAYAFGDFEPAAAAVSDADIKSYAAMADFAFDLSQAVGMDKFEPHIGGYYATGDDDPLDDDLEGWTPVVGITRFNPRYGSEQSIAHDGNPVLGQIEYSMFPAFYGSTDYRGGGITGSSDFDNPGFKMIGGGVDLASGKWGYKTNVMYMMFGETEAVENYYTSVQGLTNVSIDDFMGIEWNNELSYKLFDQVTIKGGAAFLFPGDGAEDITQALDAIAKGVDFAAGQSSDDTSMRFALELLWFF
jgi:hypothetical protein